ncbi:MAG: OmpH family outer membrane protein [Bacteroidota bacterium]
MKRFFFVVAALFGSILSYGQDAQKLGYADTNYILSQLPDTKKVESELKTHAAQLEAQMKAKADDYQKKLEDFQANASKWVDAIAKDKENELRQLQTAFQKFQQDAETSYAKKHDDLMAPLYSKIGDAISGVAKENGYTFIITLSAEGGGGTILLYKDAQYDISPLVLKKLGVTPTAAVTTPAKPQPK